MKKKSAAAEASAIDLVEEAVHLLRGAPAGLLGAYALGTLPFVLGLLYFWADMSRGAFARDHAERSAIGMAFLFLWMKCWQSVFAAGVRNLRAGHPTETWTIRRVARLVLRQGALQPSGLFFLPASLLIMIPFPWVSAFYLNVTALGAEPGGLRESFQAASRQASARPTQNFLLQGVLAAFGFFIWVDVVSAMALLPYMLKTLLGIDTDFTRAGFLSLYNTTYLFSSFALAYVFVDPLVKTAYALRCFYGQSLETGEDLKSDLRRARMAAALPVALVAAAFFSLSTPVRAAKAGPAPPPAAVAPKDLDASIDKVLQRSEFAWRMPREEPKESDARPRSWIGRFMESIVDLLTDGLKFCFNGIRDSIEWVFKMIRKLWPDKLWGGEDKSSGFSGWTSLLQILLVVLIVGVASLLAILVYRMWQQRPRDQTVFATPLAAAPDLNDENIAANQLPEAEWLKLAAEMMAQGHLRLALRAFYLAGLANLAAREMISIAVFKSNRDYESELRRRGRMPSAAQQAFSLNVAAFDRAWYGLHDVTQDALQQFQSNLELIRS